MRGLKSQVWLTPTHVNEVMYFMTYVCLDANSIIVLKLYITDHYNKNACSRWLLLHSKKLQGVSFLIRYKTINVAGKNSQDISGPWIEASSRKHIALSNSNHATKELDIGGLFFYHVPSDEKISNSFGLLKFQHCWKTVEESCLLWIGFLCLYSFNGSSVFLQSVLLKLLGSLSHLEWAECGRISALFHSPADVCLPAA